MSRIINEHTVYGHEETVTADSKEEAMIKAVAHQRNYGAWEAMETAPGVWSVYIAKHEDVFALND